MKGLKDINKNNNCSNEWEMLEQHEAAPHEIIHPKPLRTLPGF